MIRSVEWNNDPVLGNLKLDFSKPEGGIYNTIIIAGENGTGKTRVLDTLSTFLNLGSMRTFNNICYDIDNTSFQIEPDNNSYDSGFHIRTNRKTNEKREIRTNKNNSPKQIELDADDIRHYGCIYSKARSGFKTNVIKASGTSQLDNNIYENDSNDDFTGIKQLLIDISIQDSNTVKKIFDMQGKVDQEDISIDNLKLNRFKTAFNAFFNGLALSEVDTESKEEMNIVFEKYGKKIRVDDLSTGEKQIVFRGAQLLQNVGILEGGTILIDEPELSMHPKWQSGILSFYRNLFQKDNKQITQMFFATHSENVIQAAVNDDNCLVVILYNDNGIIKQKLLGESILPSNSSSEINYLAFGIVNIDYHIALYGYLQTLENLPTIKSTDDFIKTCPEYVQSKHMKQYSYTFKNHTVQYDTLPTFIRNDIDHPDLQKKYTQNELIESVKLLSLICNRLKGNNSST